MAAAEPPLARALAGLCDCLGCAPTLPRTPACCTELLQGLVSWAAPGPEDGRGNREVPTRAAAAVRASLLLLEAVAATRGDHISAAEAEQELEADSAEEAGKCDGSKLLLGGGTPKSTEGGLDGPVLNENGQGASLSLEEKHVAPASPCSGGGAPALAKKTDDAHIKSDGVPKSIVDCDRELVSEMIDPQCVLRCAVAPLLLLCGAHIHDTPWSNAQSRRLANQLLRSLLEVSHCASVAALLEGNPDQPYSTYREALQLLGPRLRKDTWESHPEAKLVFSWMLFRVPRPWLSDFLSRVMPPSLLFSDDYKPENKVLGVRCLHHIVRNVPAAELRQYNRALVVYHALRNHLYTTDAEVVEVVLPCLLDIFPVLHKPPPAVGAYRKDGENPPDQIMQMLLTHMEMEHRIALRRLYARSLPALQERLGFRIARHMKRLLRVIVGYLEVSDGPDETSRLSILETLQGTIKYAWPRIPPRLPLLLKSLLKLIYELSSESNPNSVTEALVNGATECLLLLDNCSQGQVKTALEDIPSVCKEPLLQQCVSAVLQRGGERQPSSPIQP
ncbi:TELO2-interacting protein 2 [Dendrobates tinctorius]|uniref:TELO2-interacting protein 2 n=1 Tax=Dendrobates tinctorius TaxID=92724 RepID=UPI003CC9B466